MDLEGREFEAVLVSLKDKGFLARSEALRSLEQVLIQDASALFASIDPATDGEMLWDIVSALGRLQTKGPIPATAIEPLRSFLLQVLEHPEYVIRVEAAEMLCGLQPIDYLTFREVLRFVAKSFHLTEDPSELPHPYLSGNFAISDPDDMFHAPDWDPLYLLTGALQDLDAEVREGALYAISEYSSHQADRVEHLVPTMQRLLFGDPSADVREAAAWVRYS